MKVVSIVGARPQFIKAAALSRRLRRQHEDVLVHTGQHYDYAMSGIFFDGLDIPAADINLGVGSGTHGAQTGAMLSKIEETLLLEKPQWVIVYGDTNSTLAGALAAAKLHIPVAHVEAGLRSYNRRMPEEINRVAADHFADLLLCPSDTAVNNLAREGVTRNVHLVGDVMLDVLNWARERMASTPSSILQRLALNDESYLLATVHRSENTDDEVKLSGITSAFDALDETIVFPVHPRTRKAISERGLRLSSKVRLIDPVGYLDMVTLANSARLVLTDSGGLQKEAYWLGVPCLTLREETEWVETVQNQWNILVGSNPEKIVTTARTFSPPATRPPLYGDGYVAGRCAALLAAVVPSSTVRPSGSSDEAQIMLEAALEQNK
jgi:UDP-N-acetylglucosamine 2-epimerase